MARGIKYTTESFISKAIEIHGNKYDYSKVDYKNSRTKIAIICPVHGEFEQQPWRHLEGGGCPSCMGSVISQTKRSNLKTKESALKRWSNQEEKLLQSQRLKHYNSLPGVIENRSIKAKTLFNTLEYKELRSKISKEIWKSEASRIKSSKTHKKIASTDEFKKWRTIVSNSNEFKNKRIQTLKINNSFNTSKPEQVAYTKLLEVFEASDIVSQYKSEKYPFACDYYIKSLDLYIELNYHWTHGKHPFDASNPDDLNIVDKWKEKGTRFYNNAIKVWTILDPKKLEIFESNALTYKIFYNPSDFSNWLETIYFNR